MERAGEIPAPSPHRKRARAGDAVPQTAVAAPGLHLALDAAGMVAWEWDLATGRVLWAGAHALWGTEGSISKDGSGADDLLAAVHPDDRATVHCARDQAVTSAALGSDGGGYQCEYRVIGPEGRTRWLESRGRVERRSSGRAWRIVGVSLDITDRKRADEELKWSEARYRAVIEGQTEFILRLRPDGTLSFVNDAYCRYRGLPREVLLSGFDDITHYPPSQQAKVRAAWAELVPERRSIAYELEAPGSDGAVRYEEWTDTGIFNAEGLLIEIQAVGRDVTKRRRVELALAEGEARHLAEVERERRRLQAILESVAEAVTAVFLKEGIWLRNAAWLPLHGFTSFDELPGPDVSSFAHLFDTRSSDGSPMPRSELAIARVLRGESFSDLEVRLRRLDKDHERWISCNGAAVLDPDGSVALAILTMRDITARKEAEERQRLLLRELSHRVKNTLAVVQSIATRSVSGDRTLEEAREAFAKRLRALARAHDLLTASEWRGASLLAVAEGELRPYRERVTLEGPNLALTPKAAQTLTLVLHELATNAAKHGALSASQGIIELRWSVAAAGQGPVLHLAWRERGGPLVVEPTRSGFGRTLVEYAPAHDLDGRAHLTFRPEGLEYELEAPLLEATG
jgi:PAS domain S-box-containing protein